ncbi:MAG: TolC family protein, partial [Planctomycetota bacterium]|nr:TolC family protein [Planctomycetota bacterium]
MLALLSIAVCGASIGCSTVKPSATSRQNPAPLAAYTPANLDQPPSLLPPVEQPQASNVEQASYLSQSKQIPHPEDSSGPVCVQALVQYAMANNPRIRAARHRAASLAARVPQAVSLPDPTFITTVFTEEIQTAAGPQEIAMSLSQKLPWFGKRELRGQVANQQMRAACAQVVAEQLQVIEQVKRAYFDLYFVQNAIDETRRLQPRLDDIVEIARAKYETHTPGAGMENVLQARVEMAKLKTTLIRLEQIKVETQARLAGVLHLPPATPFVAVSKNKSKKQKKVSKSKGRPKSSKSVKPSKSVKSSKAVKSKKVKKVKKVTKVVKAKKAVKASKVKKSPKIVKDTKASKKKGSLNFDKVFTKL